MGRVTVKVPRTKEELAARSHSQLVELAWKLGVVVRAQQIEIEELRRAAAHSAAHSHKDAQKRRKKKPGRKPGQGPFCHRPPPDPGEVTDHEDVPAPNGCPECGSDELELDHYENAWTTDIQEPQPKPRVTHFSIPVCNCRTCGRRDIRGKHPKVAPDQRGATAHRLGPNVMAAAHTMHYGYGVTVRKTVPILRDLTGIRLTQSAITQDAIRRAKNELTPKYQELRDSIKRSPVAHTDDTGMRMGGKPAYLMGFATPDNKEKPGVSVYQTRPQHRNEEVREVIPGDYTGTMVTDRGRSYDAKEFDSVNQQKCITHALRSLKEVLEIKVGAARNLGERLTKHLKKGLRLWHSYHEGRRRGFEKRAAKIDAAVTVELRERELTDPDNQRLLNGLGRHHDRGNLLRFLKDPSIPPTNNLQERELKLPIQARKISQGVKNPSGAYALDVHSSVIRTEQRKQPPSLIAAVAKIFIGAKQQARPP
jgi:hypothetical protein